MRPRTARIPGCLRNPHTHPARVRPADRPMTVPPPHTPDTPDTPNTPDASHTPTRIPHAHTPVAPHTSLPDRPPTGPILCRRSLGGATPPPGHQATPILPAADEQAAPAITTRISHSLNLAADRPLAGHQPGRPALTLRPHTPPPPRNRAHAQASPKSHNNMYRKIFVKIQYYVLQSRNIFTYLCGVN